MAMLPPPLSAYTNEVFKSLTGVPKDLFCFIYHKYCGQPTPISQWVTAARSSLLAAT
jgi:hypothetical protein